MTGFEGLFKNALKIDSLKQYFGNDTIFLTNQARTGLRILLNSLGLKIGDRIGVQAFNCNTVFSAINKAGFNAVFIDINSNFTIDVDDLKNKTHLIDALIVTHTFGILADLKEIKEVLSNKPIIEDCAHSFLSKKDNKISGKESDAAIFSIGNAKFPSIGEGGIVLINNKIVARNFFDQYLKLDKYPIHTELSHIIKNYLFYLAHKPYIYGLITKPFLKKIDKKNDFGGKFKFQEYKIMNSFCNILLSRLHSFQSILDKQKKNAMEILEVVPEKYIHFITDDKTTEYNYFLIPLLVESPDEIILQFQKKGVEIGRHFAKSIEWAKSFGYISGSCPKAEMTVQKIVCIPCHYNLRKKDISAIKSVFLQM